METRTNQDLYTLIAALAGTSDFTISEQAQLLSLANRRFYNAYKRTDVWPRYIIAAEPRTITNQICPFTQDGFWVFGAGTTAVNGLYILNGTGYTLYDDDGTTELYSIAYDTGTTWEIIAGAPDAAGDALYNNTDSGNSSSAQANATIAETGWAVGTGTADAPLVRDLSDIGKFIRIHRTQPFKNESAIEYDFSLQEDGAHVFNIVANTDSSVWCTYKKRLTLFTSLDVDGTSSLSEVPAEFFYYIAHGTYADFLRMDGQTDKALIEEQLADKWLFDELEEAEQVMNNNTIKQRFRTHLSQQHR